MYFLKKPVSYKEIIQISSNIISMELLSDLNIIIAPSAFLKRTFSRENIVFKTNPLLNVQNYKITLK